MVVGVCVVVGVVSVVVVCVVVVVVDSNVAIVVVVVVGSFVAVVVILDGSSVAVDVSDLAFAVSHCIYLTLNFNTKSGDACFLYLK